jgi:hypothetical protein
MTVRHVDNIVVEHGLMLFCGVGRVDSVNDTLQSTKRQLGAKYGCSRKLTRCDQLLSAPYSVTRVCRIAYMKPVTFFETLHRKNNTAMMLRTLLCVAPWARSESRSGPVRVTDSQGGPFDIRPDRYPDLEKRAPRPPKTEHAAFSAVVENFTACLQQGD